MTSSYGSPCAYKGSPYINNCNYDSAGVLLQHLYRGALQPPNVTHQRRGSALDSGLVTFSQAPFVPIGYTLYTIALQNYGLMYIPKACAPEEQGKTQCRLHVAFHGCLQDTNTVQQQFVGEAGYNAWAEENHIIVIYPQVRRTAVNPKGCFDWWGYTGLPYASKLGAQMMAVKAMIDAATRRHRASPYKGR